MRYFFIRHPHPTGTSSLLRGSEAKHIKNVLRLKPGDNIGLFDGQGLEYVAKIIAFSGNDIEVEIIDSFRSASDDSDGIDSSTAE